MKRIKLQFERWNDSTMRLNHNSKRVHTQEIIEKLKNIDGVSVISDNYSEYRINICKAKLFTFSDDIIPNIIKIITESLPDDYFEVSCDTFYCINSDLYERTIYINEK